MQGEYWDRLDDIREKYHGLRIAGIDSPKVDKDEEAEIRAIHKEFWK